jgi:arylamine N-acetyltransferase
VKGIAAPLVRYLRLLGFAGTPSGLGGLRELVRRHVCRVPFENVSKLLLYGREGRGREQTLAEFLDGLEHHDLGGTCHTSNPFFARLLGALGYDATLLGADMGEAPNVHTGVLVRLAGVAYLIDVGYAAPFWEPMPLDRLPFEVVHGDARYVLRRADETSDRDAAARYEMTVREGRERVHGYVVHTTPRTEGFFRETVLSSFGRDRTFMRCLFLVRYFEDRSVRIANGVLSRSDGRGVERVTLGSVAELRRAVQQELALPRCPIDEAVAVLERLTGRPFNEGPARLD